MLLSSNGSFHHTSYNIYIAREIVHYFTMPNDAIWKVAFVIWHKVWYCFCKKVWYCFCMSCWIDWRHISQRKSCHTFNSMEPARKATLCLSFYQEIYLMPWIQSKYLQAVSHRCWVEIYCILLTGLFLAAIVRWQFIFHCWISFRRLNGIEKKPTWGSLGKCN